MKKNGPKALSQIIIPRRKEQAAVFSFLFFLSFFFLLFLHCVVNLSLFSHKKTVLGALLDRLGLSSAIPGSGEHNPPAAAPLQRAPAVPGARTQRCPCSGLFLAA